ncbi:hypothetical protein D3C72_920460 [compost metagenome]
MHAVVQLGAVFGVLRRQEGRIVVVVHGVGAVAGFGVFAESRVDVHAGEGETDVILGARIERAFVGDAGLHVVVDRVGFLVVHRAVGEHAQAATVIAGHAGDLLLDAQPYAVFARRAAIGFTAQRCRLALAVFIDVAGLRVAVVITGAVFARQAVEFRRPHQFDRQDRALGAAAAEFETVAAIEVRRVLLVSADLCVQFRGEVIFDAQRPLTDRPVVPDAADPVADLRTAEREVLEVARKAVEVFAFAETADLDVEFLIEEFLLVPHLCQARGLATAPDFLGRGEAANARIVDAVIADVVAAAFGDGQLKLGVVPAEDLLQVEVCAQTELIAIARSAVVVVAAVQVAAHFAGVIELEVVAFFREFCASAVPVTEHVR